MDFVVLTMVALTDFERAQLQISFVMMLIAIVSVLAALAAREQAKKAEERADRAEELAGDQHRDDQLRRFTLSFDAANEKLVLTNTSTSTGWDKVIIGVVNHSEGPIAALGDAPPEPVGDSPHHFINLGAVGPGDVRPIGVERGDEHRDVPAVVRLTCWRDEKWWPVLLQVDVPPPPPPPPQIWAWSE